jgi:hypothetical protein
MQEVFEIFEFILGLREVNTTTPNIIKKVKEEYPEWVELDTSILHSIPVEGYDETEDDICLGVMETDLEILVKFVLTNRGTEMKFKNYLEKNHK